MTNIQFQFSLWISQKSLLLIYKIHEGKSLGTKICMVIVCELYMQHYSNYNQVLLANLLDQPKNNNIIVNVK